MAARRGHLHFIAWLFAVVWWFAGASLDDNYASSFTFIVP